MGLVLKRSLLRIKLYATVLLFIFSSTISSIVWPFYGSAHAIDNGACDYAFIEESEAPGYDPCDTCSVKDSHPLTGPTPSSLTGSTNQERAWNYFIQRGLTPVAAAGAMGNIEQESSFSAAAKESGGGGLGIIQWTGSRRTNLETAAAAAGVNLTNNESALLFQLNYLWDGEYSAMTWQEQVNAETTVEGNTAIASYNSAFSSKLAETQTGNGSTMVFHSLVERSSDVPTDADKYAGVGVLTGRIEKAKGFLEQFNGESGGGCSVAAGGLTFDQAVTLAKKLGDNWDTIFCGTGAMKDGFYCGWNEGYCTAGAAWLAVTTAPDPGAVPGIPNGVDVANRIVSYNPDVYVAANPDGSNLQPFSIWSLGDGDVNGQPGHTGTIVGVGTDGSIVTLETNWGGDLPGATNSFSYSGGKRIVVYQFSTFEAFKTSHPGYIYNNVATPKDGATATAMGEKMSAYIGN